MNEVITANNKIKQYVSKNMPLEIAIISTAHEMRALICFEAHAISMILPMSKAMLTVRLNNFN